MKRTAVVLVLIAAAFFVGSALAQSTPEQIPVSFQLLANDGNVYANGWYVDGAVIVEDPDDKLDTVALACCENACTPDEAAPVLSITDNPDDPTGTPRDTATPVPTGVPTETVGVSPTLEPTLTSIPTEKAGCNRGGGNSSEGCDPGSSGGQPGNAGEGNE